MNAEVSPATPEIPRRTLKSIGDPRAYEHAFKDEDIERIGQLLDQVGVLSKDLQAELPNHPLPDIGNAAGVTLSSPAGLMPSPVPDVGNAESENKNEPQQKLEIISGIKGLKAIRTLRRQGSKTELLNEVGRQLGKKFMPVKDLATQVQNVLRGKGSRSSLASQESPVSQATPELTLDSTPARAPDSPPAPALPNEDAPGFGSKRDTGMNLLNQRISAFLADMEGNSAASSSQAKTDAPE